MSFNLNHNRHWPTWPTWPIIYLIRYISVKSLTITPVETVQIRRLLLADR